MSDENTSLTLAELAGLVTVTEFAEQMGVTRAAASYWVRNGKIASVKVGKSARFLHQSDIDAFRTNQIAEHREKIAYLMSSNI